MSRTAKITLAIFNLLSAFSVIVYIGTIFYCTECLVTIPSQVERVKLGRIILYHIAVFSIINENR